MIPGGPAANRCRPTGRPPSLPRAARPPPTAIRPRGLARQPTPACRGADAGGNLRPWPDRQPRRLGRGANQSRRLQSARRRRRAEQPAAAIRRAVRRAPADPTAGSAAAGGVPAGQRLHMVNTRIFELDYDLQSVGPSGVKQVEPVGHSRRRAQLETLHRRPDQTQPAGRDRRRGGAPTASASSPRAAPAWAADRRKAAICRRSTSAST